MIVPFLLFVKRIFLVRVSYFPQFFSSASSRMQSNNRDKARGCFVDEDMHLFKAFVAFKAFDPKFIKELRRLSCQYPHPEGCDQDADKDVLEYLFDTFVFQFPFYTDIVSAYLESGCDKDKAANILLGLAPIGNRNGFQDMSSLVENFGSEFSCKDIALVYSGFCGDKDQVVDILQGLVKSKNPSGFFKELEYLIYDFDGSFERDLSVEAELEFKDTDIAFASGKADLEQHKAAGILPALASAPNFDNAEDLEDIVSAYCQAEFDKNLAVNISEDSEVGKDLKVLLEVFHPTISCKDIASAYGKAGFDASKAFTTLQLSLRKVDVSEGLEEDLAED